MREMCRSAFEKLPLDEQIERTRLAIRTDGFRMTFGEFEQMVEDGQLVVAPGYQRLFRWTLTRKSRFIESILLDMPIAAIFVAETDRAVWELVDGLQPLFTVLEFFGSLRDCDGATMPPFALCVGDGALLPALNGKRFEDLSLRSRLTLRRAGCRVEVVRVGSGRRMKHDLFERFNAGGARLSDQEIRACIFRTEAPKLVEYFDDLAKYEQFQTYLGISDSERNEMYDSGLVMRFFALKNDIDSFHHDVEPFITEYVRKVADQEMPFDKAAESVSFFRTTKAITDALGSESWRGVRDGRTDGAFSPYVYETLMLAVAKQIEAIERRSTVDRAERLRLVKTEVNFGCANGAGGNAKQVLLNRLAVAERVIAGD